MIPPQFIDSAIVPTTRPRIAGAEASEPARREAWFRSRLHKAPPHSRPGRVSQVERPLRVHAAPTKGSRSVLSSSAFESFLARERNLADRGTRRFSLLVLTLRAAASRATHGSDPLSELALRACKHLRSTDLVGRKDANRVDLLLTDTEPPGAQVIAVWVQGIAAKLGLDLEQTIFVYPTVEEPRKHDSEQSGPTRPSAHPTDARCEPHAESRASSGADAGLAPAWSMKDLWPLLETPMPRWKRTFDILLSVLALLFLSPLFVLIAIAIRLDSPGPAIFRQWRVGRGGRPFVFYKFRSMAADAESRRAALVARNEQDGPVFKVRDDPRVTRVGRWIRRSSIDELPQLWNVLAGDISLVGPRSPMLHEVHGYERWQRRRLSVTGGITCTWQVSGRSQIAFRDWMRLDLRYVSDRSLWLDLRLLVQTLPAVISGRGAS
jgi:lipopolysaccharide/colanic/teichoic acid biosynthesis glycosyltransferase